jgi:hypothetical protein
MHSWSNSFSSPCCVACTVIVTLHLRASRKFSEKVRSVKLERFGSVVAKTLFFIVSVVCGYYLLKDTAWLPPTLGGNGSKLHFWVDDYPFQSYNVNLKYYVLIQGGYQLQVFVYEMFQTHRIDLIEMVLHYCVVTLLIFFGYLLNYVRVAAVVLFCHNISDLLAYACKVFVDTPYKTLTVSLYVLLLVAWAYTRFYFFPLVVIQSYAKEAPSLIATEHMWGWSWFIFLLFTLMMLHVYW